MKKIIPIILIAIFSSSLIAGKCDIDELEKQKLASLTSDASTYRILEITLKNREDIIIPTLTISLQTELGLLTRVWCSIKNSKNAPDIKVLLTAYNDKLCQMIITHPDFFEYDRIFLRLAASLLFDLPLSENNRLELLQFIRKHYSAEEIEQQRSIMDRYKTEITETKDETIIFIACSCLAHYDDLLLITDFLQKGNRDAFKAFLSLKLAYIDSQIKIMIAASPALASCMDYKDYMKNDPLNFTIAHPPEK